VTAVLVAATGSAGGEHRLIAGTTPVGERPNQPRADVRFSIYLNGSCAERISGWPGRWRERVGLTTPARGTRADSSRRSRRIRIWDGGRSGKIAAAMAARSKVRLVIRWGSMRIRNVTIVRKVDTRVSVTVAEAAIESHTVTLHSVIGRVRMSYLV
jgi:hypothetical protein